MAKLDKNGVKIVYVFISGRWVPKEGFTFNGKIKVDSQELFRRVKNMVVKSEKLFLTKSNRRAKEVIYGLS